MSSSFCEFRDGHYHSAIDIKTWLREGYPCYAIADGRIEHIRISPFGYGKVMYIRLNDGNKAVYAHLQRFTPQIDEIIRQMQMANQRYQVDWYPKDKPVKKGDIIAYTGSTGTGLPHLHFEIRNKRGRPLNPQAYYPQIKDKIRPQLKNLAVIPISYDARINGNALTQVFALTYIKDGIYVIRKPMMIKGRVGLAIRGFDQADGAANKYGFYQTTMEIDSEPVFQITYNELSFATTDHIYTETYYPFWIDSSQVYHKLYIEPFNPLPFYTRVADHDGTLILNDSPKQFSVTVTDFKGNKSIIRGELVPDLRSEIDIKFTKYEGNNLFLDFYTLPLKDLQFDYGSELNQLKRVSYYELLNGNYKNPEHLIQTKISLPDSVQRFVQVIVKNQNNQVSKKLFSLVSGFDSLTTVHFSDKRIVLETNTMYSKPRLGLPGTEYKIPFEDLGNGSAQAVLPAAAFSVQEQINVINGNDTIWSNPQPVYRTTPSEVTELAWFDSAFAISIPAGAVLDTAIWTASRESSNSLMHLLPVASPIYELIPNTIPFYQSIEVKIRADSLPSWAKWNLYKIDGHQSLSFMPGRTDTVNNLVESRGRSLGKIVIAADTVAPLLNISSPLPGKSYKSNPLIKFDLDDELSGIGSEEDISVLIDGYFVLPEWDHEEKRVVAKIDSALSEGSHTLTISVSDQAGNTIRDAVNFLIEE
jgi:hypothetical protein